MGGGLWIEARDALAGVAELCRLKGGEGLDIFCLNSPKYQLDLRVRSWPSCIVKGTYFRQTEGEVFEYFNDIVPEGYYVRPFCNFVAHATTGQTPTGYKLRQILDAYVPRIENPTLHHKPISILVITDGVPSESLDELSDLEH